MSDVIKSSAPSTAVNTENQVIAQASASLSTLKPAETQSAEVDGIEEMIEIEDYSSDFGAGETDSDLGDDDKF